MTEWEERMAEQLRQAAAWFTEYAGHHAAKGAEDKAQRNRERAQACLDAIPTGR